MIRLVTATAICVAAAALGGCNETAGPVASAPPAIAKTDFRLPEGSACAAELNRFQVVLKSDVETGNVNQSVYDQIEHELTGAVSACSAGHDGEAMRIIHASKARHGYRA